MKNKKLLLALCSLVLLSCGGSVSSSAVPSTGTVSSEASVLPSSEPATPSSEAPAPSSEAPTPSSETPSSNSETPSSSSEAETSVPVSSESSEEPVSSESSEEQISSESSEEQISSESSEEQISSESSEEPVSSESSEEQQSSEPSSEPEPDPVMSEGLMTGIATNYTATVTAGQDQNTVSVSADAIYFSSTDSGIYFNNSKAYPFAYTHGGYYYDTNAVMSTTSKVVLSGYNFGLYMGGLSFTYAETTETANVFTADADKASLNYLSAITELDLDNATTITVYDAAGTIEKIEVGAADATAATIAYTAIGTTEFTSEINEAALVSSAEEGEGVSEDFQETPVYAGIWYGHNYNDEDIELYVSEYGVGTYGDAAFTYTVDNSTSISIKLTEGGRITATFIQSTGNLMLTYMTKNYMFTRDDPNAEPETPEEGDDQDTPAYCGTWSGTALYSATVRIVINADGTGKYGEDSFTYTVTGNKLSSSYVASSTDTCTLDMTYSSEDDSMTVSWMDEDEYYGYDDHIFTRVNA